MELTAIWNAHRCLYLPLQHFHCRFAMFCLRHLHFHNWFCDALLWYRPPATSKVWLGCCHQDTSFWEGGTCNEHWYGLLGPGCKTSNLMRTGRIPFCGNSCTMIMPLYLSAVGPFHDVSSRMNVFGENLALFRKKFSSYKTG